MMRFQFLFALLFFPGLLLADPMPKSPPVLRSNPMSPEKIKLGRMLFFDTTLSQSGEVSCNSCHDVVNGYGTSSKKVNGRNIPSVWNSTFYSVQFLDGRANSPEEQIEEHLMDPRIMGVQLKEEVIKRLESNSSYSAAFRRIYLAEPLSVKLIAEVISSYERTLITPNSPYDRYLAGDKEAMGKTALKGMKIFNEVGCTECHSGPMFNGPNYPWGVGFFARFPMYEDDEIERKYHLSKDLGRYYATKRNWHKNVWRVPSLRNVAMTGPYFHNGSVQSLGEAVKIMGKMSLGKELDSKQVDRIVEFLKSLTGEFSKQVDPEMLVESTFYSPN